MKIKPASIRCGLCKVRGLRVACCARGSRSTEAALQVYELPACPWDALSDRPDDHARQCVLGVSERRHDCCCCAALFRQPAVVTKEKNACGTCSHRPPTSHVFQLLEHFAHTLHRSCRLTCRSVA
eukprot:351486-Chlamydomonas_euryale.AAC.14